MKLIVFGAFGFIGTHFREKALIQNEIELVFVTSQLSNRVHASDQKTISIEEFNDRKSDEEIASADVVVYLGSASVPSTFVIEPWREVAENVEVPFKLLKRIVRINPRIRLIFASSGGTVYGKSCTQSPIDESAALEPISAYGLGKVLMEQVIAFLGRTEGLSYSILRIGNPIGVHAKSHIQGLVGAVLRHAAEDKHLTIFGDGSHVRDYLSANDVAEAIVLAALNSEFIDTIWNVGSGVGYSVLEIIALISDEIGRPIAVKHQPARGIDVNTIILDSSKIKRDLGWRTITPLRTEIAAMWNKLSPKISGNAN